MREGGVAHLESRKGRPAATSPGAMTRPGMRGTLFGGRSRRVMHGQVRRRRGMESELELKPELTSPRSVVPRLLRAHPFLALLTAGVLLGGGLRFVPSTAAASSASS